MRLETYKIYPRITFDVFKMYLDQNTHTYILYNVIQLENKIIKGVTVNLISKFKKYAKCSLY